MSLRHRGYPGIRGFARDARPAPVPTSRSFRDNLREQTGTVVLQNNQIYWRRPNDTLLYGPFRSIQEARIDAQRQGVKIGDSVARDDRADFQTVERRAEGDFIQLDPDEGDFVVTEDPAGESAEYETFPSLQGARIGDDARSTGYTLAQHLQNESEVRQWARENNYERSQEAELVRGFQAGVYERERGRT